MPVATELIPVDEEREEPRFNATIPALASSPDDSDPIEGMTVDISRSGACLLMPQPPRSPHLDIAIGPDDDVALLWCLIVSHRAAPAGDGWLWHVRIVAADPTWLGLVGQLSTGSYGATPLATTG